MICLNYGTKIGLHCWLVLEYIIFILLIVFKDIKSFANNSPLKYEFKQLVQAAGIPLVLE